MTLSWRICLRDRPHKGRKVKKAAGERRYRDPPASDLLALHARVFALSLTFGRLLRRLLTAGYTLLYLILKKQHSVPCFLVTRSLNSRKGQRTNQKYRTLRGSDQKTQRLEETELKKAGRTVEVNCYIFQYFVRHGLTSTENVYNWERTLPFKQTRHYRLKSPV